MAANNPHRPRRHWFVLIVILVGLAFLIRYKLQHGMKTGFGEERVQLQPNEKYQPAKTLWDWLQLVGIPVALALIAYFFQQATKDAEQRTALETQRHRMLQAYFDSMAEMLVSEEWKREVAAFRRYGLKEERGAGPSLVTGRA